MATKQPNNFVVELDDLRTIIDSLDEVEQAARGYGGELISCVIDFQYGDLRATYSDNKWAFTERPRERS